MHISLSGGIAARRLSALNGKAVQPAFVFGIFALDDGKVFFLQVLGHRASVSNADLAVVKLADGGDFCRGAGKERFISDVEFIAGELLFFHGVAEVSGKLHDGIARKAAQNGRPGRGFDHAVAHDKDVLARGFGNIAVGVEHHGFVIAVFLGFHLGKDGVDVVAGGLGLGHAGIHMAAGKAAGLDADALRQDTRPRPRRR